MLQNLRHDDQPSGPSGTYCCGSCSVALWRVLAAGGLDRPRERLEMAMATLNSRRDAHGRWRSMPFHYTLLALSEMDLPQALCEMRYAACSIIKSLRRLPKDDVYSVRRREPGPGWCA